MNGAIGQSNVSTNVDINKISTQIQEYLKDAQAHYGQYALVTGLLWILAANFKLPKLFIIGGGLYMFWKNREAIEAKYGSQNRR